MTKFFHEAPNVLFKHVQSLTDGDYALVHLFEENETYLNNFKQAIAEGREVILDNSIFELGTAFEAEAFAKWVRELRPTWFIIPDVLEKKDETIESFQRWMEHYGDVPGKRIAVAQGRTKQDMIDCFEYFHDDPDVDMVALSFDLKFFEEDLADCDHFTKLEKWMIGRRWLIQNYIAPMYASGRFFKPVHLLGCSLPQEGTAYKKYNWIYSTDTSNPVVAGLEGTRYYDYGLHHKSSAKLFKLIDLPEVSSEVVADITYNINKFREFWN